MLHLNKITDHAHDYWRSWDSFTFSSHPRPWDHFNVVVTDVDGRHGYGDYLHAPLRDELHTKLGLDRAPWFSKLDPESGLLS